MKACLEDHLPKYSGASRKRGWWLSAFGFLLFLSFLLSIRSGSFDISLIDVLTGNVSGAEWYIFWDIRVLRSLMAMAAGAGLGMAGVIIQGILKNPMASPFTLGISQGAAFGASFAIIFLGAGSAAASGGGILTDSPYLTVAGAFLGALLAMSFIFCVTFFKSRRSETVILSGLAAGAFFQAMTMLFQYFAPEAKIAAALFWTFGDVSKGSYPVFCAIAAATLFSLAYFTTKSWDFNALLWGQDIGKTLGVDIKRLNLISIALVAVLTAVITAFLGIIGFIGLIAPHIARIFTGHDNRFLIPMSAVMGALVLNGSDMISRALVPPAVIPVGIITSFWGIIVFIYLILRREAW